MANIKDVAKHAGVSIATVSRVINDSPLVTKKTRKKVNNSINELNFIVSASAQNMVKKHSQLIPLFVGEESKNKNYSEFIEIMISMASNYKKAIVLFNTSTEFLNKHTMKTIKTFKPKTVFVFKTNKKIMKLIPLLEEAGIKVVALDKSVLKKPNTTIAYSKEIKG